MRRPDPVFAVLQSAGFGVTQHDSYVSHMELRIVLMLLH